jgi:TRAP transporter TAXI family solute receptor
MLRRISRALVSALLLTNLISGAAAEQGDVLRERINKGTVGIISGGIDGTYIRVATDLASVLDDGDDLRVLPIMGKGSVQNIDDILYLRGIDIGIVQSDVFAFIKAQNRHPTIDDRIHYITKLYNEEFHLLARKDFGTVEDLAGKRINFGVQGSGTYMTASIVFETLGVDVVPVSYDQGLALEKVISGEIAALVYVAGKPTQLFKNFEHGGEVHFLSVPLTDEILQTYLPSGFSHDDYPQLIPAGEHVRTLAVGAVMAVYNWPEGHSRHRKVTRFIDSFFSRFDEFQTPPRHPKWQEVTLSALVPGWTRYKPAEDWLRQSATALAPSPDIKAAFESFLETQAPSLAKQLVTEQDKDDLFRLFLRWQASQEQ